MTKTNKENQESKLHSDLRLLQHKLQIIEAERAQLEYALRTTTARLNDSQRIASVGSWSLDLLKDSLFWSDEIFRIFELDADKFIANYQGFIDVIHPLDRDAVNHAFMQSLENHTAYDITHRLLMPDGRIKWVSERGKSDYNTEGIPIRSYGTVQDITELNYVENQLRIAAAAFESKQGIVITDADGIILKVNQTFSTITGYSADEVVGLKMSFLRSNRHGDDFYAAMWHEILLKGEWHGEIWNQVQSNKIRLHSVTVTAVKDSQNVIVNYVGTYADITERKSAEDQLRIAAITFETHEAIMITDADANIIRVNNAFEKITGYSEAEVLGQNPRLLSSGQHDRDFYAVMWQKLLSEGSWYGEVWDQHKNGTIYPKQLTITAAKNETNEATHYIGIFMDISDRKNTELALRQSESYLANILNSLDEVIWTANAPDFKLHHVNAATQKLYGISKQAFIDDPELWLNLIHPDDKLLAQQATDAAFKFGKSEIEYRILRADGQERWLSDRKHFIYAENGEPAELVGVAYDVTERKLADKAQRENQSRILHMLETSPIAVRIAASAGRKVLFANKRYVQLINTSPQQAIGKDPKQYYANPQDYKDILHQLSLGGSVTDKLIELSIPSVGSIWAMASYALINYENEEAVLGWFYDVTDLRKSQDALQLSEKKAKQSLEELKYQSYALEKHAIVAVTDVRGRITYANEKFCAISGYSYDELIGQDHVILNSGLQPDGFWKEMYRVVAKGEVWHDEVCNRAKDGHLYWVDTTIAPYMGENGKPQSYISIRTDISERKAAEEKSNYLALYDALTGLPNRRLLNDRLNQALASSTRSGRDGALLFLDLDHFKTLNDTLGHDVGDYLLQQVAQRLTASVREGDTVARLGGDEFVVILEELSEQNIEAAAQAKAIGEKIMTALNRPYQLATHEYHITPSIGVTLFNNHQSNMDELLKQADIAMYQAKKLGRNALSFFDPEMQNAIHTRVDLEHELRKALENKQFLMYYQIQVDASNHATGAEALIRWIHPERGLISPFHFIPVAEETGMILAIGQWVLDTACAQLKTWEQDELTHNLTLSINVSAKQFRQANFVAQVQETILQHAINPMLLKLELTESILVDRIDDTIETMNALKGLGIRFSLDDFGTGYSSLQYLKLLPLYQLKIDQSFVRDIAIDSSDQAIVRTIIAMAHTLNLNVIAEGVETDEQQGLLKDNGCLHYQGYLFSKPVPIDQFEALLKQE
ncbi:MAG: PAS domain S-box protein [Methylotenera sp.]|nr:PAS domain S-box protein [Methylotenera sp.]